MTRGPLPLPGGRFVVPGNRWDLVPAGPVRPGPAPSISVVVPYYRDRQDLDLVLAGLRQQDYPAGRFEIVVADDGSPEPLVIDGAGDSGGAGPAIRVVRQEDRGFRAGAARNLGAAVADGELLCFVDQDTVPEPGYLRHLSALAARVPDALSVGRRRHADLTGWTPERTAAWLAGTGPAPPSLPAPQWLDDAYRRSDNLLRVDDTSYRFIISAVMCCGADLFREIGGFDESFTRYGGEDWELAFRAYNAGAVLAHEPAAVAWHNGPDWGARADPETRRAVKAVETAELNRRIPRPTRSDPGASGDGPVDLLIRWSGTAGVDDATLEQTLAALTGSDLNLAVHLDPDQAERSDRPRVTGSPISPEALTRARHLVTVHGETRLTPDHLDRLRTRFRSGAGRVVDPGTGISAVALRAVRRAERWQSRWPDEDLVDLLFGAVEEMPVARR
jgi:GT2 family glycosyltransferase